MDSSQSGSRKRARTGEGSATSSKSRKTSTYDRIFEQHLIDHGVYPEGYGDGSNLQEPYNLEEIQARLIRPRASLSPSSFTRQKFLDFKKENQQALTENGVMSGAFRTMAGAVKIPHQENLSFGNLKHLTDGSIVPAQPDFYDGTLPEALSTQIRDELKTFIIPSTNPAAPCLPNFFTEGKGPKGATDVCKLQATYDGALGARAMHQLRSYIDPETAYDNNAYTINSTYHPSGLLTLYTTHPVKSKKANRECEYHMTQLDSYAMTGNPDKFREGASALRNGRELMDAIRKASVAAANAKALNAQSPGFGSSTQSLGTRSSNQPSHVDSETSADELALDHGVDSSTQRVAGGTGKKRPTNPSSNEYFKGKKRGP